MKALYQLSFFLLFTTILYIGCSDEESPVNMSVEPTLEERIQEIIDNKVGPGKLVGAAVSIRVNGVERWNLAGGMSDDQTTMSSNMRFGIASITKTAVAATILKLEEEGKLSIEDEVGDWLDLNTANVDPSITIFQLLNHLTGVKGYFHHPDIWSQVESNLDTKIEPEDLVQFIGEPEFTPGEQYKYSNSNYLLLGLIIRSVTGKEVGEVMREKFWGPLNLNEIYFGTDESPTGPIAAPWRDGNGDGTLVNIASEYGPAYHSVFFTAADIFSTVKDLSHWAYHLYGGLALANSSKNKMLNFLDIDSGTPAWNGYGLGVRRIFIDGHEMWGHTGGMRGYGSYMLYDPATKVSIAMLNNQSRSENGPQLRFDLVDEILKIIFEELEP